MRETVWDTVGPEWCSRSTMRARMGVMPSSSSSSTVRRYISVVSIRSPLMVRPRISAHRGARVNGPRWGVHSSVV